jgi:sporulation protein YlmC with PRC-barrel domain
LTSHFTAQKQLDHLAGKRGINLEGGLFMKMNQNLVTAMSVISGVTLLAGAGQAQTYDEAKQSSAQESGANVSYNNLQKANKIIGMEITDPQEHKLGTVKDLAIDLGTGRIAEVIAGTGGFIGIEEKMIGVPPGSLSFANAGKELRLNDAETFRTAPFFRMSHWNEATSSASVADVYQRFHIPFPENLGYLERADKIMGLTAKNQQREHLGKVDTLVVDLTAGRVVEVILASGGFLGIKDELSAVPPQAFRFNPDRDMLTLDTTRETLKSAPHFKPGDWRNSVNDAVSLSVVYNSYNVPPYFAAGSADTTGRNAVPNSATIPANSGDTQSDVAISVRIQQRIMAFDGLSADARKVQVTAQNGRVTLRGTADSLKEKEQLGDLAATEVASDHVDNQMEVKSID